MAWVAVAIGGSAALSAGGAFYTQSTAPEAPSMASTSRKISKANAELLPYQRAMEAAQQAGEDYTFFPPKGAGFSKLKLEQLAKEGTVLTRNADGSYTAKFSGAGAAQVAGNVAKQEAAKRLSLAEKYDAQFIDENLRQLKEADPESVAARAKMDELIQRQNASPPISPVAEMLDRQVLDSVQAANENRLTGLDQSRLDAAVGQALAERGGGGAPADFAQPLLTGFAGEERKRAAANNAIGWLASGASPEDIAYRREQQNLGNLSARINGQTPTTQFASLSSAQQGPTPVTASRPLMTMPNNEAAAQGAAMQNWQTSMNENANNVNMWTSGLSTLISAGGMAGAAGWKPFAK